MRKATFLIGFATGYVLGAKAGRTRYEQIMGRVQSFMGTPKVQDATHTVQTQAGQIIDTAKRVVGGRLGGTDVSPDGNFATAGATGGTGTAGVDPYPT